MTSDSQACEACGRPPRSDGGPALACDCPIIRTPHTLSGAWRLAGTRVCAMTLLSAWVEHEQDMERTLNYMASAHPHLGEEDVREAIAWLRRHHQLVVGQATREWAAMGLDELAYGASIARRFGVTEDRFVELAADAARSAFRLSEPEQCRLARARRYGERARAKRKARRDRERARIRAAELAGRTCHGCGRHLPPSKRRDAKWCDWRCRNAFNQARRETRLTARELERRQEEAARAGAVLLWDGRNLTRLSEVA